MILNKPFTEISNFQYTSLLDQPYGYKLNGKFINYYIIINLNLLFTFYYYNSGC
jgi:hypothetical protein